MGCGSCRRRKFNNRFDRSQRNRQEHSSQDNTGDDIPYFGRDSLQRGKNRSSSAKGDSEAGHSYVPEGRRVFPEMTIEENLNLGAMNPKAREEREENLKEVYQVFPILKERRHQLAGTLSGGELQFLAIGRGMMGSPKMMMIDEPSLGLSPIAINNVFETVKRINQLGKTILIVEQNVPRLLKLASYTYVMENGKIVNSGPSEILEKNQYITQSYLGI